MYVEKSLHPWDEADLFMVNILSYILLDLVYHYFMRIFARMFAKEIGLQFLFLDVSLSDFGMTIMLTS
jgi:hypothetical protein